MRGALPDDLLWELPRAEAADDAPAPPDAALSAYREGTLAPEQVAAVEWSLAGSRLGRARLAELAGIRLDAPSRRHDRRGRLVAATLAAAASLALVALLVFERGRPQAPTPHALPEFELRVEGLAALRGTPGGASSLPDGRVRVTVEPRGDAAAGLHFAAYRLDERGLTRLAEPSEIRVEAERGSAILTAEAERLVGPTLGTRPFFVVVTDRALPPDHIATRAEDAETALQAASGARIYRVLLTIVDATDGAP